MVTNFILAGYALLLLALACLVVMAIVGIVLVFALLTQAALNRLLPMEHDHDRK